MSTDIKTSEEIKNELLARRLRMKKYAEKIAAQDKIVRRKLQKSRKEKNNG